MMHDRFNAPLCREMYQMTCDECEELLAQAAGEPEETMPGHDDRRTPVDQMAPEGAVLDLRSEED